MGLLIITTLLILIGDIGRCIVVSKQDNQDMPVKLQIYGLCMFVGDFPKSLSMHFISLVEWILDFTVQMCYLQQLDLLLPLNKLTTHLLMKKKDGSQRQTRNIWETPGRAEYGHATPNRHPAYGREDQELAFDDDEDDYFEDIDSQEWDFGGAKEKCLVLQKTQVNIHLVSHNKTKRRTSIPSL